MEDGKDYTNMLLGPMNTVEGIICLDSSLLGHGQED
jgi:hypothetical protein